MTTDVSPQQFRYVLGNYPTGVTLITASGVDGPIGMVVGTFTSVSLDPPLVGFLPARTSTTWPAVRDAGSFAVNVLSSDQESVCRDFATKSPDRFSKSAWRDGELGAPVLVDAVAHLECTIESVSEVGDHDFVVGRVHAMGAGGTGDPLLFFHGGYGGFRARSMVSFDAGLTRHIRLAALVKDQVEQAAQRHGCGCLVLANVGSEMVVVSSYGEVKRMPNPAFAGLRQPFMAPLGMQFGAFLTEERARQDWIDRLLAHVPSAARAADVRRAVEVSASVVRERGYTVSCDPEAYVRVTGLTVERTEDAAAQVDQSLAEIGQHLLDASDPVHLEDSSTYDVFAVHAPVRIDGEVALSIGLYPVQEDMCGKDVDALGGVLLDLVAAVERTLGRPAEGEVGSA